MNHIQSFERLVLGGIEADFCEEIVNTRWKSLDEIYKIYILLHRSDFKMLANIRPIFVVKLLVQEYFILKMLCITL